MLDCVHINLVLDSHMSMLPIFFLVIYNITLNEIENMTALDTNYHLHFHVRAALVTPTNHLTAL